MEIEEQYRIEERLRLAQEERKRLEEAEMWRQRRIRARHLIIKNLKANFPSLELVDWTMLNSMPHPPEGVKIVTGWLYYLIYLANGDEANEYNDLNRVSCISYKEIKKFMLLPNFYRFLNKYDLFIDDVFPKLSDDQMEKIVEYWKVESSRMTFLSTKFNSRSAAGCWITIANIITAMSQMINWKDFILSYEQQYDGGDNLYKSVEMNQFYQEHAGDTHIPKNQEVHDRENEILKIESELNEYQLQEELNNERRIKLEEFENKRSLLLKDLQRISQEYSFIEGQIGELQTEEQDLLKESDNLENSNARSKVWYPKIKDDFECKMKQVTKLKEECYRIRTEMDKKKRMIEDSVHGEYNEEYQRSLDECSATEKQLVEKKQELYEQLRLLR